VSVYLSPAELQLLLRKAESLSAEVMSEVSRAVRTPSREKREVNIMLPPGVWGLFSLSLQDDRRFCAGPALEVVHSLLDTSSVAARGPGIPRIRQSS
jgi:hypothetical protein